MNLLTSLPLAEINFLDFSWTSSPEAWVAMATLTIMEIVLGIDNIVFISILVDKLPVAERPRARFLGLGFAMLTRILLLASISWVIQLKDPIFAAFGHEFSGKDMVLVCGGLFLLYKATVEIHHKVEGYEEDENGHAKKPSAKAALGAILVQIAILDIVFSLDSVITAVGMVDTLWVMVVAVVTSMVLMLVASTPLANFVSAHPTIKMLALSFLVVVGVVLIAEGFDHHVPKGYVYFAMAFSVVVEMLNINARKRRAKPVELHSPY